MTEAQASSLRRIQFEFAMKCGEIHLERLAPELAALHLPKGSYVIVNVVTGEYVTAESRLEAARLFRELHSKQVGWAKRIDRMVKTLAKGGQRPFR